MKERTHLSRVGAAVAIAALWWGAPVQAQPVAADSVAVAPLVPSFSPRQPLEIAIKFQGALAEGMSSAPWSALDAARVRSASPTGRGSAGCAQLSCIRATQQALDASYAVAGRIDVVGKNYSIEITLHGRSAQLGRANGRCDICTLREALQKTTELTRAVAAQASSHVIGKSSRVTPDRKPAGTRAKTTRPPVSRRQPKPPAAPQAKSWPLWPALAAAGVAAFGLGVGIPLLAVDGNGTDCRGAQRPDDHNCERMYSTAGAGWALTSIGLASLAAGGVLLYLHWATRPEEQPADTAGLRHVVLVPSEQGVVLGAGGTF